MTDDQRDSVEFAGFGVGGRSNCVASAAAASAAARYATTSHAAGAPIAAEKVAARLGFAGQ